MLPPAVAAHPDPTGLLEAAAPAEVGAGRVGPAEAEPPVLADGPEVDELGGFEAGVLGVPRPLPPPPKAATIWSNLERSAEDCEPCWAVTAPAALVAAAVVRARLPALAALDPRPNMVLNACVPICPPDVTAFWVMNGAAMTATMVYPAAISVFTASGAEFRRGMFWMNVKPPWALSRLIVPVRTTARPIGQR